MDKPEKPKPAVESLPKELSDDVDYLLDALRDEAILYGWMGGDDAKKRVDYYRDQLKALYDRLVREVSQ